MSKTMENLEQMLLLKQEIEILERKKNGLLNEIESLEKIKNRSATEVGKESAKIISDAENKAQVLINKANETLNDAIEKFSTAKLREQESRILEQQIKDFRDEKNNFEAEKKSVDYLRILSVEKEQKAKLLIEQYTKKLEELGVPKEEVESKKKKKG